MREALQIFKGSQLTLHRFICLRTATHGMIYTFSAVFWESRSDQTDSGSSGPSTRRILRQSAYPQRLFLWVLSLCRDLVCCHWCRPLYFLEWWVWIRKVRRGKSRWPWDTPPLSLLLISFNRWAYRRYSYSNRWLFFSINNLWILGKTRWGSSQRWRSIVWAECASNSEPILRKTERIPNRRERCLLILWRVWS